MESGNNMGTFINTDQATITLCVGLIQGALPECDDLRKAQYRGDANPVTGHCYVASEVLLCMLRNFNYVAKPMFIRHEGEPHWYLEVEGVGVVDPTVGQFSLTPNYADGRGKGFLTSSLSKRALTLVKRMGQKMWGDPKDA
jgi:hypothetical protein